MSDISTKLDEHRMVENTITNDGTEWSEHDPKIIT